MPEPFLPVERMLDRAGRAREESDTAYFLDLLYLGEMVVKVLVIELLAALQDDREQHRYGLEYRLVRADGIGEWVAVLEDALTGPASQHLLPAGRDSQKALTEAIGPGSDVWQRKAVDLMSEACRRIDPQFEDPSRVKVSLRHWLRNFAWLRNRTRGHGAVLPATLSAACPALESSIAEITAGAPAFHRSWAYLRRNLSRKYRVSTFGGNRESFAYLAQEVDHSLPDGCYIGNVFTNIPPRRDGYIARTQLEAELSKVLTDERNPVVTLQGRGGVGKTSLALEVLHQLASEAELYAIVWFSARDIDLLPEGPRVVRAEVLSTEDVARGFVGLMRPGESTNLAEAQTYFTDCLSGAADDGPFLFVFDNFETIREQSELYAYVNNAIRLPNKVLITTRNRDFKADHPIEVRGMSRQEYHVLVEQVSTRLGIRELVGIDYEDQLYDESDGHPYITKVLLGEVAADGRRASLKRVIAAKDAMLDALFDRSFAALSPAAQRVFLTLCSWRSLVPRIGLEAVLLRPANERFDVEQAIAELEQSSLVEEVRDPQTGSSFMSVPLAAAVFGKKKLVTSPLKIAIDADLELVRTFGATTAADVALGLVPRIHKLTMSAARRAEGGEDVAQELGVIEYIATEFPPAWLNLSELQEELGRRGDAIHSINRYLSEHPFDHAAWKRLAILYRASDDALGEMHARLQLAELSAPDFDELSSSVSRLNGLLARREIALDADERRLMVRRLRSLMEARWDEADATDLSRLAWLCIYDGDQPAATRWVTAGLAKDPENQHCLGLSRKLATQAT